MQVRIAENRLDGHVVQGNPGAQRDAMRWAYGAENGSRLNVGISVW
jgi:hypothetical protein